MKNISPLRYPGGKTRACKKLEVIINKYFNLNSFNTLISPFFGGGSFEFFIQNNYNINIIANDKFNPLYTFWNTCIYDKNNLYQKLIEFINKIDKNIFIDFRQKIMNEKNDLTKSIMYFIINRCSFNGSTLSGGFSLEASKKRFTMSSINKINNLNLTKFSIYNLDFLDFINNYYDESRLMFLDPPYYLEKGSKLYGNNGDMHENFNHDKLFQCLFNKKNWFMTYNNCEYIKKLYKDFIIIDLEWSYGMNKSKSSSEIIIISHNDI
jgi:DNA adenine methylase